MGPGDPVGSLIAGIMGRSTRPSWRGAITLVTITGNRLSDHRAHSRWNTPRHAHTHSSRETFVKLRSRSRSGEGQVRVRIVRVRSVSGQLKGFNFELKILT